MVILMLKFQKERMALGRKLSKIAKDNNCEYYNNCYAIIINDDKSFDEYCASIRGVKESLDSAGLKYVFRHHDSDQNNRYFRFEVSC